MTSANPAHLINLPPHTLLANGILNCLSPDRTTPLLAALQAVPNLNAGLRHFSALLCRHYSIPHDASPLTKQLSDLADIWQSTAINVLQYFATSPEAISPTLPRFIKAAAESYAENFPRDPLLYNSQLAFAAAFIGQSPARLRAFALFAATQKISALSYNDLSALTKRTISDEWTVVAEYFTATVNFFTAQHQQFEPLNLRALQRIHATNVVAI